MSKQRGWDALNGQMTDKVACSEFSAHLHWALVEKLTGIKAIEADEEMRIRASEAFIRKWDYDFFWFAHSCVNKDQKKNRWFPDHGGPDYLHRINPDARTTNMGHAIYQENATGANDFSRKLSYPFSDIDDALKLDPIKEYGVFDQNQLVLEFQASYDELNTHIPDAVTTGGVYITLFSGLIEIFGWEMLLMLMTEPTFDRVIEGYYQWVSQQYEAYAKTDIPVIVSHDDLMWATGPITSLKWYREHIFPWIEKLWAPLKASGKKIVFTCDGDMSLILDDIIALGADMIITEPMTNFDRILNHAHEKVAFFGTFDTRILLLGTKDEIRKEVQKQMDKYKDYPGFFFGTGNHIPQNTPVDNVLYYKEAFELLAWR